LLASEPQAAVRPDIFVIGASAGGVEALEQLVQQIPSDFSGSLFIVLHMMSYESMLPEILAKRARLPVIAPRDHASIAPGTIYVSVPDHHLILDAAAVRAVKGPMQHRHRPAVDVLFRTAAAEHGPRVVGVVLTGMLDDGTAGLLAIKRNHGITVVQDPEDARFPDMPRNALRKVPIDHCLPLVRIPRLLVQLSRGGEGRPDRPPTAGPRLVKRPPDLKKSETMPTDAKPSAYSCPECHGVLWEIADPDLLRFRCRVGHGYSPESLGLEQDRAAEEALWAAVRSLEEQASLSRRMAEHWRTRDSASLARELELRAERSEAHALRLRELLMSDWPEAAT
jgi:two-component system, chemotaxis family, protein-glutamate methylesterase/glutaminase